MATSIITTGVNPANLRPGIRMTFGQSYENIGTMYDKMFEVKIPDARAFEEDIMMSTFGLASVKPEGATSVYDIGGQMYVTRYVHVQYENGFVISQEALEDSVALKLGEVYAKALKDSMIRTREIIPANFIANVFGTSKTGDGVSVCNSAHPVAGGLSFSNVPTSPATLSEAAIEQACIDIRLFTDNRGLLINVMPDKIIIHPNNEFQAHRVLDSVLQNNTANNAVNVLRSTGRIPGGIVVNPYLTSTTNWFVTTDRPGMVFFNRKDITLSDDNDFSTENMLFKALMRFSVGCSDARSIYGVNS